MDTKLFYILKGNNGATYIFNTKSWSAIKESLKFYRARSLKAKVLKLGLHYYLFLKGRLFLAKLKSTIEINHYLQKISITKTDFNINERCSVLISPTQDKVIVNHHNEYFQKFAFDKSYKNVKKEAVIYRLFTAHKKHFQTSDYDTIEDHKDKLISFKLSNKDVSTEKATKIEENLVPVLIEFFKTTNQNNISIKVYVSSLQNELQQLQEVQTETQEQVLETIKTNYGTLEFPLGLVHRDFKPWNVLNYSKPLIFDFEEARTDGPPLEDLLNYYIDPIIRHKTTEAVVSMALNKKQILIYKSYLSGLNIRVNLKVLLHFYLIERMLFWYNTDDLETAICYKKLSDHLILHYK